MCVFGIYKATTAAAARYKWKPKTDYDDDDDDESSLDRRMMLVGRQNGPMDFRVRSNV